MEKPTKLAGLITTLLIILITLGTYGSPKSLWSAQEKTIQVAEYKISGHYNYKNLSLFLIHGEDKLHSKSFLTLQEAMEQKIAVVHETGDVNELKIENISDDLDIYIQSGDIVKGGKQDRVIEVDFVLPSKSGRMVISSFCVEAGRWSQRAQESVKYFSASGERISSKNLKIAVKKQHDQKEVWDQVSEMQTKLRLTLGADVVSEESQSSLQLTLENEKVQEASEEYVANLDKIIDNKSDVIGFAFAINGEINSADVYASNILFNKLWPKLLKACAVEAVADFQKDKKFSPITLKTVATFLTETEKGKESEREITERIKLTSKETENSLMFETNDLNSDGVWIHRNYIKK